MEKLDSLLDFLINYLLNENGSKKLERLPKNLDEKKRLWRSLCNIREVKPIGKEYLKVEKEFLQEELKSKNITCANDINHIESFNESSFESNSKICLWQGDITTLKIDAIVNAANSRGLGCFIPCHRCIDNQINTYAGVGLRVECGTIMKEKKILKTSEAIITKGYNLPAKYVIHTVGPIVYGRLTDEKRKELANCYTNSLELAKKSNIKNIAFPCISTGEYMFPKEEAVKCAFYAVDNYLKKNNESFDKIVFNLFSKEDVEIYERYIKENR